MSPLGLRPTPFRGRSSKALGSALWFFLPTLLWQTGVHPGEPRLASCLPRFGSLKDSIAVHSVQPESVSVCINYKTKQKQLFRSQAKELQVRFIPLDKSYTFTSPQEKPFSTWGFCWNCLRDNALELLGSPSVLWSKYSFRFKKIIKIGFYSHSLSFIFRPCFLGRALDLMVAWKPFYNFNVFCHLEGFVSRKPCLLFVNSPSLSLSVLSHTAASTRGK